jgi:rubrerythrin
LSDDRYQDIAGAYAEASVSAARNRLYAAMAKKEGDAGLAKLLNAMAASEEVQANRILMHLRGKIETPDRDRIKALAEEKFNAYSRLFPKISHELYEAARKTAGEAFEQFGQVFEGHFRKLEAHLESGADEETTYYICGVCGYIAEDDVPGKCPVCGAVGRKFSREG